MIRQHKYGNAAQVKDHFADGGAVSKSQAKRIAKQVVMDHVKHPAPKGHGPKNKA